MINVFWQKVAHIRIQLFKPLMVLKFRKKPVSIVFADSVLKALFSLVEVLNFV